MGGSAFLQSSLYQMLPSSVCSSPLVLPSHGKVARKKRASVVVNGGRPAEESGPFQRRVFLFVSFSFLPFLQPRQVSAQKQAEENMNNTVLDSQGNTLTELDLGASGPITSELDSLTEGSKMKEQETSPQWPEQTKPEAIQTAGENTVLAFLNGIGIIVSGAFATLFVASQKEKKTLESTIDSMKVQLSDKDAAADFLQETFETRLSQQHEELKEQLRSLNEEKVSLSSRFTSAKEALAALDRQLQVEKRLGEELKAQRDQLEHSVRQAREEGKMLEAECNEKADRINVMQDKLNLVLSEVNEKEKNIQNLKELLTEKESECKKLNSNVEQASAKLAAANSSIEQLEDAAFEARKELDAKGSIIDDLHSKMKLLTVEKDDSDSKLHNLVKECNDLISSTEKKDAFNSELLSKKDEQLQQLKENLKLALSEATSKQNTIFELARERDVVIALVEREKNCTSEVKNDLQRTQELLATGMTERSEMSRALEEARTAYKDAISKISEMQDEHDQARMLLNSKLEEAKAASKILSDELESANEAVRLTEDELVSASNKLKAVIEEQESLKKEFVDTYKMVEAMSDDLKEESKQVTNLSKELEALQKQVLQDSEARKALEADLDKATRSLNEMNESTILLSKELEYTASRSASLEAQQVMLYKSLAEQKNIATEAQESIEDAQNLINKLGGEKQNLDKRSRRLVEELAAAKGEILRLRRQITAAQEPVDAHPSRVNEVPAGTPFSGRRNGGRKKSAPSSDAS